MRRVAVTICDPLLTTAAIEGIRRAIAVRYPDAAVVRRHARRAYIVVETDPNVTRAERREIRRRHEGNAAKPRPPRRRAERPPRARAPATPPGETMKYRLQVVGLANGKRHPSDGEFVRDADVDAANGVGEIVTTPDPAEAMFFTSADAAWIFWQRQSATRPYRADGLPNRPLTAFHMLIEPVE